MAIGSVLRPEQLAAIEAHLHSCGGRDTIQRVGSRFAVRKVQLLAHFSVVKGAPGEEAWPERLPPRRPPASGYEKGTSKGAPPPGEKRLNCIKPWAPWYPFRG